MPERTKELEVIKSSMIKNSEIQNPEAKLILGTRMKPKKSWNIVGRIVPLVPRSKTYS